MSKKMLIICAHSDDQTIGVGGTAAKYAAEGYEVQTIILSFGEKGNPHFKREVLAKARVRESQRADRVAGGSGVTFLGLKEGSFEEQLKDIQKMRNFKRLVKTFNPDKIFTHAFDDAHSDHRAVFRIVKSLHEKLRLKADLYCFEVWHLFNIGKRTHPKLVVDISKFFKKKVDAMNSFKSQIHFANLYNYVALNNFLVLGTYLKDWINGLKYDCTYAEVFYKIK